MVELIIWVVLVLLILLGVVAVFIAKKSGKRSTDYYNLFLMGIIWLPFGVIMSIINENDVVGFIFITIGLIYTVVGLSHKKDWKKNGLTWSKMSAKERNSKIVVLIFLSVLVLIGFLFLYLVKIGVFGAV